MTNDPLKKPLVQKILEMDSTPSSKGPAALNLASSSNNRPSQASADNATNNTIHSPIAGRGGVSNMPPHQQQQHNQVGNQNPVERENLLPEDDIATFFRNRSIFTPAPSNGSRIAKMVLAPVMIVLLFVSVFNFRPTFARQVDHLSHKWFGIRASMYVPAFGPRKARPDVISRNPLSAEHILNENDPKFAEHLATLKKVGDLDPLILAAHDGHWKHTEAALAGKCSQWAATKACVEKGFYYAHRGMPQMIGQMSRVTPTDIKTLSGIDQGLWYLARSLATKGPESQALWQQSLETVPSQLWDLRRLLIDERIKHLVNINSISEADALIATLPDEPKASPKATEIAKWRALTSIKKDLSQKKKALSELVALDRGTLQNDLTSIGMLGPTFIQCGQADRLVTLADDALTLSATGSVDPTATREASHALIRGLVALGRWTEVESHLAHHNQSIGEDAVTAHFTGVLLLRSRLPSNYPLAVRSFQFALRAKMNWQSLYGIGIALTREGQTERVKAVLAQMRQTQRTPEVLYWQTLLEAELATASGHPKIAVDLLAPLYRQNPNAVTLASVYMNALDKMGKDKEAERIRIKLDDVQSKTGYLSSIEMMQSPLGPLALTNP